MVDAADLKSATRKGVGVRVPSWAPMTYPREPSPANSRPLHISLRKCRTAHACVRAKSASRQESAVFART